MASPRPTAADLALIDPDGRFLLRLAADRAALVQAAETADDLTLQRLVHGLAGAAGTFGYAEIGERAMELDDLLVARNEGAPGISGARIKRATTALLAALKQAQEP